MNDENLKEYIFSQIFSEYCPTIVKPLYFSFVNTLYEGRLDNYLNLYFCKNISQTPVICESFENETILNIKKYISNVQYDYLIFKK